MIIVIILRVQERISHAHESTFYFAQQDHGLKDNVFVSKIAAIFSNQRAK